MTPPRGRSTSCRRSPMRSAPRSRGRWTGCRSSKSRSPTAPWRSRTCATAASRSPRPSSGGLATKRFEDRIALLGDGTDSLYEIGPSAELHGQPVEPLAGEDAGGEATIVDGDRGKRLRRRRRGDPGSDRGRRRRRRPGRADGDRAQRPRRGHDLCVRGRARNGVLGDGAAGPDRGRATTSWPCLRSRGKAPTQASTRSTSRSRPSYLPSGAFSNGT